MDKMQMILYLREYVAADQKTSAADNEVLSAEVRLQRAQTKPQREKTHYFLNNFLLFIIRWVPASLAVFIIVAVLTIIPAVNNFVEDGIKLAETVFPSFWDLVFLYLFLFAGFIPGIILAIAAIYSALSSRKKDKIAYEEKLAQFLKDQERIPEYRERLQQAQRAAISAHNRLQLIGNRNVIHPSYLPYASSLLSYLEKGRADTLKEAINLLEANLDQQDRLEEEREYRNRMEHHAKALTAEMARAADESARAADESGRAADAASDAAAWSAANVFLTAYEARHKDD